MNEFRTGLPAGESIIYDRISLNSAIVVVWLFEKFLTIFKKSKWGRNGHPF